MDFKKGVGYGLAIWVIMFVLISALIAFNMNDFKIIHYLAALVAPVLSYYFVGLIKPKNNSIAISYGALFVLTGLILDYLITMRFNATIFTSKTLWISYLLVLVVPLFQVKRK